MSDGITDAHRENRFKLNFVPKTPPTRCKGCVFITCSPHNAQWECMNPIESELLDKDNTCIYHLTAGELAEYCRRRLMAKLKGGTKVQEDTVNRPPCKWLVNHYCNHPLLKHTGVFKLCLGCKYHEVEDKVSNTYEERVPCKWLHKNRDYANQWYCKHPKSMKPDAFKITDYCLGCSVYEPCNVNDMSKDTELQCKHLLDNSHCANMDGSACPFVSMWDKWVVAGKMCKHYEFNVRYEVHVLGNSTSIIGVFKTREQAEQFIRDNVKVVEMIP